MMILGKAPLPNDEFVFGGWGFVKILPYENARAGWMEDSRKESTNRVD